MFNVPCTLIVDNYFTLLGNNVCLQGGN